MFTLRIKFKIENGRRSVSRIRCINDFPLANLFVRIDAFSFRTAKGKILYFLAKKIGAKVVI